MAHGFIWLAHIRSSHTQAQLDATHGRERSDQSVDGNVATNGPPTPHTPPRRPQPPAPGPRAANLIMSGNGSWRFGTTCSAMVLRAWFLYFGGTEAASVCARVRDY